MPTDLIAHIRARIAALAEERQRQDFAYAAAIGELQQLLAVVEAKPVVETARRGRPRQKETAT